MQSPRFLIILLACLIGLAAAAAQTPTAVSSTAPAMLGITLTPTDEAPPTAEPPTPVPPTATPEPVLPTATPVVIDPTAAPTATPLPTQPPREDDDDDDDDPAPVMLPSAGIGPLGWAASDPAAPNAAAPASAAASAADLPRAVARISIPRLGLEVPVRPVFTDGYSWDIRGLGGSVGWLAETGIPGEAGNAVLVGHLTDLHALPPFRDLAKLAPGDLVTISTNQWTYVFEVKTHKLVRPDDLSVLDAGKGARLTLLTCADWSKEEQQYLHRRVVTAELVQRFPAMN